MESYSMINQNMTAAFPNFIPEPPNLLYERYQFFKRCQQSEESLLEYVEEVKRLAKSCAFDTLQESLVRDRVIFGIRDIQLKEEIVENGGDPSLGEAIILCQGRFRLRQNTYPQARRGYTEYRSGVAGTGTGTGAETGTI